MRSVVRARRTGQGARRLGETQRLGRLRRAWRRARSPWAALEALLCGTAVAFFVLWLELPDGTVGERVISATMLLFGVALGTWAQAAILIAARRPVVRRAAWRGALWLLGLGVVYGLVALLLDAGALQDGSRAAYLEERTFVWHVANARELVSLEAAVWWVLRWALAGAMLPLLIESVAGGRKSVSWKGCTVPLREGLFWATVMGAAATWTAVSAGTSWFRPVVPVAVQVVLTVVKVGLLFAVGVAGLCFAVALTGTYLRDRERETGGRPKRHGSGRAAQAEVVAGVLSTL